MTSREISAEDRRDLWADLQAGEEWDQWDYGQWVADVLGKHLEAVETIIGTEAVAGPFRALLDPIANEEGVQVETWREAMEAGSPGSWPLWSVAGTLNALALYGRYGVLPRKVPFEDREAFVEEALRTGEEFLAASGLDGPKDRDKAVGRIVRLARARRTLETGKDADGNDGIEPGPLAILGGLSEGRLRNMMSGSSREIENSGGKVPAAAALAWLHGRPAFFDSIWQRKESEGEAGPEDVEESPITGEIVFVPMARDGTLFHPGLARGGHYTIGAKGGEERVESFAEALQRLQRMPVPRWRRPNAEGNWGIVQGTHWTRLDAGALPG